MRAPALALLVWLVPAAAFAQQTTRVHVELTADVETTTCPVAPSQPPPATVDPPRPAVSVSPIVIGRGAMLLTGERDLVWLGGSAGFGLDFNHDWRAAIIATYLSNLAPREELDVTAELQRDLDAGSELGLVVVGAVGAAIVMDALGTHTQGTAQLGIGARVSIGPRVAIAVDARGVLRFGLPDATEEPAGPRVTGGLMLNLGLHVALD